MYRVRERERESHENCSCRDISRPWTHVVKTHRGHLACPHNSVPTTPVRAVNCPDNYGFHGAFHKCPDNADFRISERTAPTGDAT